VDYNQANMTHPIPAQGRQRQIGVTFLAWLNIYQNLKQAIQDVIAPEMQQIRGDIKALSARMDAFEKSIDARFVAVDARFDAVDQRFDAVDRRLGAIDRQFDAVDRRFEELGKRIDGLAYEFRMSLDIRERLAALEARFEKKN
jgi:predicted  nucleic acid-binding Zn-ribbon protein